jgi:hypothetical protein
VHQFSPLFRCKNKLQIDGKRSQIGEKKNGVDRDRSKRQLKLVYYWHELKWDSIRRRTGAKNSTNRQTELLQSRLDGEASALVGRDSSKGKSAHEC